MGAKFVMPVFSRNMLEIILIANNSHKVLCGFFFFFEYVYVNFFLFCPGSRHLQK